MTSREFIVNFIKNKPKYHPKSDFDIRFAVDFFVDELEPRGMNPGRERIEADLREALKEREKVG